jgi:hypothetical protein
MWMSPRSAGGKHDGPGAERAAIAGDDARHHSMLHIKVLDRSFDHLEARRCGDGGLHGRAIELAVGLRSRPLNGRPLAFV